VSTRHDYEDVFGIFVPIAVGVFVLFLGLFLFAALRWRRRAGDAAYVAGRRSSAPLAEGLYAFGLAVVAVFLVATTYRVEDREDRTTAAPALDVKVTASDWQWRFDYPAQRITRLARPPAPAVLVVPAGEPIRFTMTSLDVIHAFWVPELRFKRDAFPHRTTTFDLVFDKPGLYGGECAEFCGLGHSSMRFRVNAMTPADFRDWVRLEKGS
jgi:cytochrome c oxidase subunit 2